MNASKFHLTLLVSLYLLAMLLTFVQCQQPTPTLINNTNATRINITIITSTTRITPNTTTQNSMANNAGTIIGNLVILPLVFFLNYFH
jgi:hypothetical protein